ncbi:MAG: hypothetical protein ACLFPS_05795 [Clostridia bacterium]
MPKEEKTEEKFELVRVPTDFGLAFKSPEGENLSTEQLLVQIANDLNELKKKL